MAGGTGSKERRKRAHILMLADINRDGGGRRDADITGVLGVGPATIERLRKPCVMEGVVAALQRKVQRKRNPLRWDREGKATLTMLAEAKRSASRFTTRRNTASGSISLKLRSMC